MSKFNKTLVASAIVTGLAVASFSNIASAQTKGLYPAGPVWINGYVSVNNVPKGGNFTDFACKVKGHGRIVDGTSQILIEGVQALHRSSGQIPRGCHTVVASNLPWIVEIHSQPTPDPNGLFPPVTASTGDVTVTGVVFQAVGTGQPGCGTDAPGTIKSDVIWRQDVVPFTTGLPQTFDDPAYSTLLLDDAEIQEDKIDGCRISGILKITRPVAPSKTTVTP